MWRIAISFAGVLVVIACSDARTPVAPSPASPPQDVTTAPRPTINGTVYEVDGQGRLPLPGVGIDISPEFQSWRPSIFTDSEGRFTGPYGSNYPLKIIATKANYSQPCRGAVQTTTADHEVYIVSNSSFRLPVFLLRFR